MSLPRRARVAIAVLLLIALGVLGRAALAPSAPEGPATAEVLASEVLAPESIEPAAEPSSDTLAELTYAYREHAKPDRTVSTIEVRLETRGEDRAELVLEAKAVGPLVQPPRGFRWIAGENPVTAREIERLESAQRLGVVTREVGGGEELPGGVELGPVHEFAERRITEEGRIELHHGVRRPSSLRMSSGVLGDGEYDLEVQLDGAPRLRVRFGLEDGARFGHIEIPDAVHPEDEKLDS